MNFDENSITNLSSNTSISWQDTHHLDVTLDVVALSIYLVIGVIGNSIVLVVYKFRMGETSEERYFIPVLAWADLIACMICTSMSIAWDLIQLDFDDEILCKFMYYTIGNSTFNSVFVLLCIAVQRYMKICRNQSLKLKWRRIMLVTAIISAVSLSSPLAVMYGIVDYYRDGKYIGKRCGKKLEGVTYGIVVSALTLTMFSSFLILYGRIGYTIRLHSKRLKQSRERKEGKDLDLKHIENRSSVYDNNIAAGTEKEQVRPKSDAMLKNLQSSEEGCDNMESGVERVVPDKENKNVSEKLKRHAKRMKYRISIMFMVITSVFLICFSPIATLLILEGLELNFWETLTSSQMSVLLFLYHSYIINNIINPFIYTSMDGDFKRALYGMFRRQQNPNK